jgi:hypothetical protein
VKTTPASQFALEITNPNFANALPVWRLIKNLLHRPVIRMGMARDDRGHFRDPRFVSFLSQNNRRRLDTNFHDAFLRGRRLVRYVLWTLLGGGCAWVLIESAKALSVF